MMSVHRSVLIYLFFLECLILVATSTKDTSGKMWEQWSEWSEVTICSRRCGGGKQRFIRSRSCSSTEGCHGESEYTERECYPQDCQCKILTNQQTEPVASFCSNFTRKISYPEKEDFCKFTMTEKLEALLCTQITPAEAETLLNVAYDNNIENCEYDPTEVFDGDCGQILQDKLSKTCNNADCQSKQSEIQGNIDKVIDDTDKLYRNKIEETDIMIIATKGQLALLAIVEGLNDEYGEEEYDEKEKEIMGEVLAKLKKNADMEENEKSTLKDKASKLLKRDTIDSIDISATTTELKRLEEKEKSMIDARTGIKRQYNKLKENIMGMSSIEKLEKTGKAVDRVIGSITKFKSGDTMSVIDGVLDIAAGISQFIPPPASIVTETISSIFAIFSGGNSAPTTESVIKDEFKKQKEWMEEKFDEVDKRFDGLEDKMKNYFETIDDKLDKNFDELKTAIESIPMIMTESQKELLLLKGLTDQKRNALGIWHTLELKLAFIIDNEGTDHSMLALSLIVQTMNFFDDETAKLEFRDFVETECKNITTTAFREHCQVLAYAALMIERTDEIVLTKTMALLAKSGSLSSLDYSSLLETRQATALKFLEDIFTSTDENAYSYISCGLSEKSNAKLTDEQKSNLFAYAAHLNPTGRLTKRMEQRKKCVDGSNVEPWKTYSISSAYPNAALDEKIGICCKKGRTLETMTCSEPKNGGVDCPSISRCSGFITLGYCPGVKSNEIIPGTILRNDDTLTSPNGKFKLVMQRDGNLVFYSTRNNKPYWSTKTDTCPGAYFLFQHEDGNMVIFNHVGGVCWASHTDGQGAGKLAITDDLDVKLTHKTFDNRVIWNMRAEGLHHRKTSGFLLDGGEWGTWGNEERCSFPHFVSKMELKIEDYFEKGFFASNQYRGDNTALNGIMLTCSDDTTITSKVGERGTWRQIKQCNSGSYINQAEIKKEERQKKGDDDAAATGINFICTGSNAKHYPGDVQLGDWQGYQSCPPGAAIVGLRTVVQDQGKGDNTALNKVHFFCALLL